MTMKEIPAGQDVTTLPPWHDQMDKGDFISYAPSYTAGAYFNLFEKLTFTNGDFSMTWYLYNPVAHGADPAKKYPVLVSLHGTSCALNGEMCISNAGAELFASPEYQKAMGGAFVLVPIANEYRIHNGDVKGYWDETYEPHLAKLISDFKNQYAENLNKVIVQGCSSGGFMAWVLVKKNPQLCNAVIPIGGRGIPSERQFIALEMCGCHMLILHGKHDELIPFDKFIAPSVPRLQRTKNCKCFFPEWVRNSDGGVSSINFGIEMGQHCLVNAFQENLMFADGRPMWEDLPNGITGWIRDFVAG